MKSEKLGLMMFTMSQKDHIIPPQLSLTDYWDKKMRDFLLH